MLRSLIRRIKQRMVDMSTVSRLCKEAERYAHLHNEELPGEENFLLAALDLEDGTARRVFQQLGTDSQSISAAIDQQYKDALQHIGINADNLIESESETDEKKRMLYDAKPSAKSLMQALVKLRKSDKDIPLLGAHVLEVIADKEHGVAARTLKVLGIEKQALKNSINNVLAEYKTR